MKVLVACEFSQVVTKAFRDRGHEAYSCDLLPTEGNPDWHCRTDIRNLISNPTLGWDLMIAHPPCTRLANSGVRWLQERDLWDELEIGANFFRMLLEAPIQKICIENPIPHKYAVALIGRKYDQLIQPWQYGNGESKATCLWLNNLPNLQPTNIVPGREQRIHMLPPGVERWKDRSRTFPGIADAMASQWG